MRLQDLLAALNDQATMSETAEIAIVSCDGPDQRYDIVDVVTDAATGTVQVRTCPACKQQ